MNDDDATAILDRLSAGLPDPRTPVGLVDGGRRLVRRRARRRAGAVLAAVVVAVTGVAVGPQVVAGRDAVRLPSAEPPQGDTLPDPPAGTRWAGLGTAVVAVPEHWATGAYSCNGPQQDTVFRHNPFSSAGYCIATPDESASTLELVPVAADAAAPSPRRSSISCDQPAGPAACSAWLTSRRDGVEFLLTTKGDDARSVAEDVLDSFTVLPEGWTTVPWPAVPLMSEGVTAGLRGAGLRPVFAGDRPPSRSAVATIPAPSTPVPIGTEVLVQKSVAVPDLRATPTTARPGVPVELASRVQEIAGEGRYALQTSDDLVTWRTVATASSRFDADELGTRISTSDTVIVPDVASGLYRLCTNRAPTELCTYLYITP